MCLCLVLAQKECVPAHVGVVSSLNEEKELQAVARTDAPRAAGFTTWWCHQISNIYSLLYAEHHLLAEMEILD